MKYDLKLHGDPLEKYATDWVRHHFGNYEVVCSEYIGHNGLGIMAQFDGYPYPDKRSSFAEYSYTILQSAIIIDSIINSGVFYLGHDNILLVLPGQFRHWVT